MYLLVLILNIVDLSIASPSYLLPVDALVKYSNITTINYPRSTF